MAAGERIRFVLPGGEGGGGGEALTGEEADAEERRPGEGVRGGTRSSSEEKDGKERRDEEGEGKEDGEDKRSEEGLVDKERLGGLRGATGSYFGASSSQ